MAMKVVFVLSLVESISVAAGQQRFINTERTTKYAAIGLVEPSMGVERVIGTVKRSAEPLMQQTEFWEKRCDNGYPNVLHNPEDPHGAFRLWYGCFTSGTKFATSQGSDRTNGWLYANSSDGIHWEKPDLGVYDLAKGAEGKKPGYAAIGNKNNIVLGNSDGVGITYDTHETDPSKKFKLFGSGIVGGKAISGVASSPDGIHWGNAHNLQFPKVVAAPGAGTVGKQRYDCHQQPLWDEEDDTYVLTTRTYPGTRAIGLLRTPSWPSETEATETLTQVEVGNSHHQLYSQITFRFYDIWLGLVMVFDADDAAKIGTVHCRLSWSPNGRDGWSWVDTTGSTDDGLTGPVFLPLGPPGSYDSHITFAADAPVIMPASSVADDPKEHIRVYYMGGNGPHNGPRNTSLGMSTLRMDGFAGIFTEKLVTIETRAVLVTGPVMRVTADFVPGASSKGSLRVGMIGPGSDFLRVGDAVPVTGNVTDGLMTHCVQPHGVCTGANKTFAALVGKNITLAIEFSAAILYTVSFGPE